MLAAPAYPSRPVLQDLCEIALQKGSSAVESPVMVLTGRTRPGLKYRAAQRRWVDSSANAGRIQTDVL